MSKKTTRTRVRKPAPRQSAAPTKLSAAIGGLSVSNGSDGQQLNTERPFEISGNLEVRGQTNKTESGEGASSYISAIVGHAQTLTVTNLNINVNTNSPATSAEAHTSLL